MIDPDPWRGDLYRDGIKGWRVAIIGYSHHGDYGDAGSNVTIKTVQDWRRGRNFRNSLFPYIEGYFDEARDIWNHVMFLNYLSAPFPSHKKYDSGCDNQIKDAKARFLRIIQEYRPCKALVFTRKGWAAFPPEVLEKQVPLDPENFPMFSQSDYDANGHVVMAFGLRHPQGARRELMRSAVQHILGLPCRSFAPGCNLPSTQD